MAKRPAPDNPVVPLHSIPLALARPADWHDQTPPGRVWIVPEWLPARRATLLTGDGGSGKSLLAQQMATSIALGLPFMGMQTRQQRALYLTCEDDLGELHRRQHAICQSLGIGLGQLGDELHLCSRVGFMDNSLVYFDGDAGAQDAPLMHEIKETCQRKAIFFIVLDNIAHLFDGNENIRNHVAVFCNALEKLAIECAATILFIGHPSKGGAQFSGSTAWENQVRNRIFLERPGDDDADDNRRTLRRSKSNYARTGDELNLIWRDWAFDQASPQGEDWHGEMVLNSAAAGDNDLFLKLLRERDKQGRPVSSRSQSRNFAPRELAKMPKARGVTVERFERAMERLMTLGTIEEREVTNPKDRHRYRQIVECGPVAGQSHGAGSYLFDEPSNSADQARGPVASGPVSGPDIEASAGSTESRAISGETAAGQLHGKNGDRGGREAPPIGGLSLSPAPDQGGQS